MFCDTTQADCPILAPIDRALIYVGAAFVCATILVALAIAIERANWPGLRGKVVELLSESLVLLACMLGIAIALPWFFGGRPQLGKTQMVQLGGTAVLFLVLWVGAGLVDNWLERKKEPDEKPPDPEASP